MKTAIALFSALLLIWIAGSSYVYVCKVRKDCCVEKVAVDSVAATADTLQVAVAVPVPPMHVLYFDFNKSICAITDENTGHFELIRQYLSAHAGSKVRITGHSDAIGPDWAKEKISVQRADFIRQKLAGAGIAVDAVETTGASDRTPASDNSTSEGRAKNRRAEILIQ